MQNQINEIQGYSLFNDVEDAEIRIFNRARSMKNIILDNADKHRNVTLKGVALVATYQKAIPEEERSAVHNKLVELLQQKETV